MGLRRVTLPSGRLGCNGTVLWDEASRAAVVIDPTDDAEPFLEIVGDERLDVRRVLLTHAHADHAADIGNALAAFGCEGWMHPDDAFLYEGIPLQARQFGLPMPGVLPPLQPIVDGEILAIEKDLRLEVRHVPGHSPGSVAFVCATLGTVWAGDVLFRGSIGRTDLPGGDFDTLEASIRERIYTLPDATVVVPGHGPDTEVGFEKRHNPYVPGVAP